MAWGAARSVQDVVHNLYLIYWDADHGLLFINSTNNVSTHEELAKAIAGNDVELIRGEPVYRCLHGIKRLVLSNLGLLHLLGRAVQFTMHVGTDVGEGLARAAIENRRKSNLFGRGYECGTPVTIGASHKGRVWSHWIASDIYEWIEWCRHVGAKLIDEGISTEAILKDSIIPEQVSERPRLVPLTIEWPPYFAERSDEATMAEVCGQSVPFYEADLAITTFRDTGPLRFAVIIDGARTEYEGIFEERAVRYEPVTEAIAHISVFGRRRTLSEWFREESPIITFSDTTKLEYNEIFRPKSHRTPYDPATIERWDWTGTVLTKESQYIAHRDPPRLELRTDSIQYRVIERLGEGNGPNYDIVFDDNGRGEIADIVAIKSTQGNLLVHLFHLKYSKSDATGVRVDDLYEVCGQAQKSVKWRSDVRRLFKRLRYRESGRYGKYGISRFVRGDLERLEELSRQSRVLRPEFRIFIVQPGLDAGDVNGPVLDLLSATELYLRETFDIPLTVIGSVTRAHGTQRAAVT